MASHVRIERGKQTNYDHYPPERVAFMMRTPAWCRRRAGELGPSVAAVADPFHVVAVDTRCVDATRRRVQNDTLGHRGRKADPLYRCRKLLAMAEERLEDNGTTKLRGLLAAGDPAGHVHEAWTAKECLRDLYTLYGQPELAGRWIDGLIEDCRDAKAAEVRGVARTLKRWRDQILAWHSTGASNGPTEGLNSIIKKVKRVGAGFRSFANYRLRMLLARRGMQLVTPQPRTPLKREGPDIRRIAFEARPIRNAQ